MKLLAFFLFFLCFLNLTGQIINIPDQNFKNKLLESGNSTFVIALDSNGFNIVVDNNNNNEIELEEAVMVYSLYIYNAGIADLTGIEYFTNLEFIDCSVNNLTNINISQLKNLEHFGCWQNQLTSLDLSALPNLKNVFFYNNQISSIDFSNNPLLEVAYCGNNPLTTLDFSNNPVFKDLGCQNSPNLTSINIKNDVPQIFGQGTWLNQCWSGCPSLTSICADEFEIEPLQTYLTSCGVNNNGIVINDTCVFSVEDFNREDVVITPNPFTDRFTISQKNEGVPLKKITLYDILGNMVLTQNIDTLNTIIEASFLTSGVYIVLIENDIQKEYNKIIKK